MAQAVPNLSSEDQPEIEAQVDLFTKGNSRALQLDDTTYIEVMLGESLLTPGLQTSVVLHSFMHQTPIKNFDALKGGVVNIRLKSSRLSEFYRKPIDSLEVSQTIYRLENRVPLDVNSEALTIRACDPTLLNDARSLVSKSWKCTTPSEVVGYVLRSCAGARVLDIESSTPARDYVAENIHPFQVVSQQANVALAAGDDPSFVHYMTYQRLGTHHFRSLYSLTKQSPVETFHNSETGYIRGYNDPQSILAYSFPCDFDLLSDILNGIDESGNFINSLVVFNPLLKMFSMVGNQVIGCGIGGGANKMAQTNLNSSQQQNSCNFGVEKYLLKRQARMSLLEKDKIALRMTVPWNPSLNVGKIIRVELFNKDPDIKDAADRFLYGSGDYLILHMIHTIKRGGYATTTIDCVSKTVGEGIV